MDGAERGSGRNASTVLRVGRIATVLALALVLAAPASLLMDFSANAPAGVTATGTVVFRTDASPAEVAAAGARIVAGYSAFALVRGPSTAMDRLTTMGRYAVAEDTSGLRLLGGTVDVNTLPRTARPAWTLDASGRSAAVVHFIGPIDPAWEQALSVRGVNLLRYLPTDALLVSGRPAALEGLGAVSYVDYVGPYQAGWKVRSGTPTDGTPVDLRIVVLPGERTQTVEAWLAHAGVPPSAPRAGGEGIVGAYGTGDFQWVRATIDSSLVPELAALPEVEFLDPVVAVHAYNAEADYVIQTNQVLGNGSGNYKYWWNGLDGRGQFVAIADTGLDYDNPMFRQSATQLSLGDLYNVTDASRRKVVRYLDMGVLSAGLSWPGTGGLWDPYSIADCPYNGAANGHGTAVASVLAGNDVGLGTSPNDGNALNAKLYMQDIGGLAPGATCTNGEDLIYLPQDYADLFGLPGLGYNDPLAPVRIHSDSWGADVNEYDVQARMVDAYLWSHPDLSVFFAAGNAGPSAGSIGTPGTAKDVVSVGGACNADTNLVCGPNDLASFSGRGPTSDGRIAPTILTVADGDSATSDGDPLSNVSTADHGWAGTSYATPEAAAAAAIVRQYFTDGWYPTASPVAANGFDPSAALIRAMLIASGVQITGEGTTSEATWPNNDQGFGRVLLSNILPIATAGDTFRTQVVDETAGLLTGQAQAYTFHVTSGTGTLRFVLAWTDYPGTLGASRALVNDLDLQVTAPNGTAYFGNHFGSFATGQSVPSGSFDRTNVEEAVILKVSAAGDYRVRVIGANVPVGPQPFALVATGPLDPNYGRATLDRPSYRENGTVGITVIDGDAAAVQVRVTSGLEPAGETVALTQAAPGAPWRGSLPLAFGQPALDGVLEVRDGDTITATYQDASPAHTATATASVVSAAPAIGDVAAMDLGATTARIGWTTDLPAAGKLRYGTAPTSLTSVASAPNLRLNQSVDLKGLQAGTTYYYDVIATDHVGHATLDDNGGAHYAFQTAPWGDVLVVIGDATFPPEREASYAAALNATGWTWSFWRVADAGLPPLARMQAARAVVWQPGLEEYPMFNATARGLVQAYLDGGGRLLVTSHDTGWSLGSTDSPWYTAASSAWLHGVLKASFACDPNTTAQMNGIAGDPVSGAFAGGISYQPHRVGGADDQLSFPNGGSDAGGTSYAVWTDSNTVQGCPANQPVGLRWVSSSGNGTAGVGVWGGTPSRLEYFAFEVTGLDTNSTDLRPASPTRAQVIDNALRWLVGISPSALDRDHPDVVVSSPDGGTFPGPSVPIAWTATAFGPGIVIANVSLAASPDGGQTWTPLATLPGSATSYAWSLAGVPNGDAYVVRVSAADSGTPALTGIGLTNLTFAVARTGGDTLGPLIRPGSLRESPDPPGAAAPVIVNATADDGRRGDSGIAAAELFFSLTAPPAAANGTGIPMDAVNGTFGDVAQALTWPGTYAVAPGSGCVWVHAQDAAGNWGPYASLCRPVLNLGPDVTPPAPAQLASVDAANAGADLRLTWAKAWDDGLYGGTVGYTVSRATSPAGPYTVLANLTATGNRTYAYVDAGRGLSDPADYFYRVRTADAAGNTELSPALGAKYRVAATPGLNLLGSPVASGGTRFGSMASGLTWNDVLAYDACAGGFGWRAALPGADAAFAFGAGDGLWLNASTSGDVVFLGVTPAVSRIGLCPGWNLVALPGFLANLTVADLEASTGALIVEGFGPTGPWHVQALAGTAPLVPGQGYWVYVTSRSAWTVNGW